MSGESSIAEGPALESTVPALELIRISRRFGNVQANDQVSMTVNRGEIHALLGENGAGKTTLMRVVAGIISPDSGLIQVDGETARIGSPDDATRHGIQMVHQHFALVGSLTVAENLHLARLTRLTRLISLRDVRREMRRIDDEYSLEADPDAVVDNLSVGARQRAEIARALYLNARILILDEPTAVLTPPEVADLLKLLQRLREQEVSVIFISHKLPEVLRVSDRVTVLRDARVVTTLAAGEATADILSRAMVGRAVPQMSTVHSAEAPAPDDPDDPGDSEDVLRVRGLTTRRTLGRMPLADISFVVRRGEILGMAGVDGNGQSEVVDCIFGLEKYQAGEARLLGKSTIRSAFLSGVVAHIPDDRSRKGIVGALSVWENILLRRTRNPSFFTAGFLRRRTAQGLIENDLRSFGVRSTAMQSPARTLSGGNQQRLLLARELAGTPKLVVAAQPSRGLDIAGTEFVHDTLRRYRAAGSGILLISTELDEIFALADRIAVLFRGQIMGILGRREADPDRIGLMMAGALKLT